MELLFAAFFTTASASTSLVLLLLQHPAAIAKIQQELAAQGLGRACGCALAASGGGAGPPPDCGCEPDLSLAALGHLRYVGCVVKEVLRLLPPVSGGYRTALRTFELDVSAPPARPALQPAAGRGGRVRTALSPFPFSRPPGKWAESYHVSREPLLRTQSKVRDPGLRAKLLQSCPPLRSYGL